LTPGDAYEKLLTKGIPSEVAENVRACLGQLDEAMYRPDAHVSITETAKVLVDTLAKIDQEVVKCG
jgi:hypothetical protein